MQLGDGAALSAALGVPVVYDFRAADMEKGGQGAPLVPIFHRALAFHEKLELPVAFVNIGGIANVTYVPDGPPEGLIAFDAGAGNCLLDDWAMKHTGEPLDRDSRLALAGTVNRNALQALLSHPFFSAPPPKSLDRGAFAFGALADLSAADGAATLTAFTVAGIAAAARHFPAKPRTWIISGGGTHNPHMMEGLRRVLGPDMMTAEIAGFSSDFMEAQAFAYLAARRLRDLPVTFPGTTGVARSLGGRRPHSSLTREGRSIPSGPFIILPQVGRAVSMQASFGLIRFEALHSPSRAETEKQKRERRPDQHDGHNRNMLG